MKDIKDGRSISREVLEEYRFRALELKDKNWKVHKIAEAFGLHRGTVSNWFTTYRREGKKGLKQKKAKGREPKLTLQDKIQIISWLKLPATEFGFETPLWNCKRIQQLIKKNLNKTLAISNIWGWLKKWNLTNQKPERQATQQDENAVKTWLKEEWPKIKEHARRWQAMLYFQDESGVSLIPVLGKTWAPKGKTPTVKLTGKRGGLCISSAISPAGRLAFRIEKERVTRFTFVDFLIKVMKQHPHRKVIIVTDNAPAHTAKFVREFALSNDKQIAVYYIPAYSPKLNPDEHVWAYLKAKKLVAHQAQTTDELKHIVKNKMQDIQRNKHLINSFFMGTYVI